MQCNKDIPFLWYYTKDNPPKLCKKTKQKKEWVKSKKFYLCSEKTYRSTDLTSDEHLDWMDCKTPKKRTIQLWKLYVLIKKGYPA